MPFFAAMSSSSKRKKSQENVRSTPKVESKNEGSTVPPHHEPCYLRRSEQDIFELQTTLNTRKGGRPDGEDNSEHALLLNGKGSLEKVGYFLF